jgi:hypothetical protein
MRYLNRVVENLKKLGSEEAAQVPVQKILLVSAAIAMAAIALDVGNYVEANDVKPNGTSDHGVTRHHYSGDVPKTVEEFIERSG